MIYAIRYDRMPGDKSDYVKVGTIYRDCTDDFFVSSNPLDCPRDATIFHLALISLGFLTSKDEVTLIDNTAEDRARLTGYPALCRDETIPGLPGLKGSRRVYVMPNGERVYGI